MIEASRITYIFAFLTAGLLATIAGQIGSLLFEQTNLFTSITADLSFEGLLIASLLISTPISLATWIMIFLSFSGIYFRRVLWFYICGGAISAFISYVSLSEMVDSLIALNPAVAAASIGKIAFGTWVASLAVPIFFVTFRADRYHPPTRQANPKRDKTNNEGKIASTESKSVNSSLSKSEHNTGSSTQKGSLLSEPTSDDDHLYETALNEFVSDTYVNATYAKALSLSEGDEIKAKWKYVELRVARLKSQDISVPEHDAVAHEEPLVSGVSERLLDIKTKRKDIANRAVASTNTSTISKALENLGYSITFYNDASFGGYIINSHGEKTGEFFSRIGFRNLARAELNKVIGR